ncbi:unnamed protein product [Oppiella nova]|uniref:Uncharacterized protein n=1 Tax=Oppiella nova TaxID=334625 RepID=A0A7R9QGE0_9ACAR|nr:unnamed protein product [Oppiella nova]CAG2165394.1 unnamed protein product [Oppiella nova]
MHRMSCGGPQNELSDQYLQSALRLCRQRTSSPSLLMARNLVKNFGVITCESCKGNLFEMPQKMN